MGKLLFFSPHVCDLILVMFTLLTAFIICVVLSSSLSRHLLPQEVFFLMATIFFLENSCSLVSDRDGKPLLQGGAFDLLLVLPYRVGGSYPYVINAPPFLIPE